MSKKIIHYKAVLWDEVDGYLAKGWELYGPPLMGRNSILQAMVKYEEGEGL